MSSQLEKQQSIEMENENIVEEILMEEKGKEYFTSRYFTRGARGFGCH